MQGGGLYFKWMVYISAVTGLRHNVLPRNRGRGALCQRVTLLFQHRPDMTFAVDWASKASDLSVAVSASP